MTEIYVAVETSCDGEQKVVVSADTSLLEIVANINRRSFEDVDYFEIMRFELGVWVKTIMLEPELSSIKANDGSLLYREFSPVEVCRLMENTL